MVLNVLFWWKQKKKETYCHINNTLESSQYGLWKTINEESLKK